MLKCYEGMVPSDCRKEVNGSFRPVNLVALAARQLAYLFVNSTAVAVVAAAAAAVPSDCRIFTHSRVNKNKSNCV